MVFADSWLKNSTLFCVYFFCFCSPSCTIPRLSEKKGPLSYLPARDGVFDTEKQSSTMRGRWGRRRRRQWQRQNHKHNEGYQPMPCTRMGHCHYSHSGGSRGTRRRRERIHWHCEWRVSCQMLRLRMRKTDAGDQENTAIAAMIMTTMMEEDEDILFCCYC